MKKQLSLIFLFSITFLSVSLAQTTKPKIATAKPTTKETALTNKTIVDLVGAGLDDAVVIAKIESSTCKFNVNSDELISLKKQGISSAVIKAMIDKSNNISSTHTTNNNQGSKSPSQSNATGAPVPDMLSEVNYYNHKTNSAQLMEKQKAALTVKGIMGNNYSFEIDSAASSFRITTQDSITFLVSMTDAMGEPAGWFTLYKLDVKKNKRSATWVNTLATGKNATKNIIDFKSRKTSNGVFEMIPGQKLEKGEYLFLAKGSMANYAGRAADIFAFGVD